MIFRKCLKIFRNNGWKKHKISICAVIAARNEAHCLRILLPILAQQDIDVAVIDNGSTDNSYQLYFDFKGAPVISVDSIPFRGYSLPTLLDAKQVLYDKLDYDWLVHHDADEILEHREQGTLRDAIEEADRNGYTALNFEEFVFLPEPDEDYFGKDYYSLLRRYYFFEPFKNRLNRAWKQGCGLSSVTTGGHRLDNKKAIIDPTNHILRHYSVFSQAHARTKYLNRSYDKKAIERGWHRKKLNLTKENLTLPDGSEFLFQLDQYDSKDFRRDTPALKHFWQWNDTTAH